MIFKIVFVNAFETLTEASLCGRREGGDVVYAHKSVSLKWSFAKQLRTGGKKITKGHFNKGFVDRSGVIPLLHEHNFSHTTHTS